jgi:Cytochrome oxidase complex assembly protein 1
MNQTTFCKALIVLMLIELLCVICVPVVRANKDVGFDIGLLTVGITLTVLFLRFRKHNGLGFLARPGLARFFFSLLLCVPPGSFAFTACDDLCERRLPIFHDAINLAEKSDVVKKDLGAPMTVGWPVVGNSEESQKSGHETLQIPVSGNRGRGSLLVVGTKTNGVWKMSELTLISRDGNIRESLSADGPN